MPRFSSSARCLSVRLALLMLAFQSLTVEAADSFQDTVLPFVKTYCIECHNQKKTEGQLDLTRYTTAEAVAADYRKWEHVVTFVTKEEMPPPDVTQPAAAERAKALRVLGTLMLQEARKTAGDPGVVLPRRLSNAEYNYAIRDLTGVDIRPADSFPIDPASGEGFSNTGEALVMSPSLFKKYYAAAQHVADHALLTPTRMEFAPHPVVTFADQTKLTEQANRTVFPAFDDSLKQAMFEEPTRLATHLLQNDLSLTELLRSDTTLVNKRLAQHYGLPFQGGSDDWELATGLHEKGRGGLLGMAVFLTKNSQPQRTSPVKRGFWVVHKLLGEHIPPPPPDVAVLPAKETDTDGKTIPQLLAMHTDDVKCARCHVRFDSIGLHRPFPAATGSGAESQSLASDSPPSPHRG